MDEVGYAGARIESLLPVGPGSTIRSLRRFGATVALIAVAGCGTADLERIRGLRTSDGRTVEQLCTEADTTALLLFRPTDCVSCYSVVSDWMRWEKHPGRHARVVLTEPLTTPQRIQLASYGLQDAVELTSSLPRSVPEPPLTALCLDGRLRALSVVMPDSDPLLLGWLQ